MPLWTNHQEYQEALNRMPTFTDAQVAWLEDLFPARCKTPLEGIEEHMLYAGKVELVAFIRSRTPSGDPAERTEEQDEEAQVAALEEAALKQLRDNTDIQES